MPRRRTAPRPVTPRTPQSTPSPPVVALGASAGGLDALKAFFTAMPAGSGAAFVVIVHLDPFHASHLPQILTRHTSMPVREARDGEPPARDQVYVIAPKTELNLQAGAFRIAQAKTRPNIPKPIDTFLASLAADVGDRAIGIIASGSGNDGSQGIQALKDAGAMVLVQTPDTAEFDDMPRNAIATGLADHVVPMSRMPGIVLDRLRALARIPADETLPVPPAQEQLQAVLALLRTRAGLDFHRYKAGMLLRRIERRMALAGLQSLQAYRAHLGESPAEVDSLVQDLMISVTRFFREPKAWDVLEHEIIPTLLAGKNDNDAVRVWVPGCATGEEAYTTAMVMLDQPHGLQGKLQIFATDIDQRALSVARTGRYPAAVARHVGPARLARFFTRTDDGYQVTKALRESVVFAPQNLITDAPFSRLDLVICRNVLIYLEPDLQQKVINMFSLALRRGGYLVLGRAETLGRQQHLYETVSLSHRIYRTRENTRRSAVELPLTAGYVPLNRRAASAGTHPAPADYAEKVQALLLRHHSPAAVLISRDYQVLYFHGATDAYLAHPSGVPTEDLMSLVREDLRLPLRAALHQSMNDARPVTWLGEIASVAGTAHSARDVKLTVHPVQDVKYPAACWLVTFESTVSPERAVPSVQPMDATSAAHHLERELTRTKHELHLTIEELEASNQELKAANEEALSVNEEMQSTNEELETSKEELQSLNEELTSVNAQLEEKIVEIEASNNDLNNLLASSHIATLFLDRAFRIRRFTPACTRLFNLIPADVGRPLTDLTSRGADQDMRQDAEQVLRTLVPVDAEVLTADGEWYLRRVLPYRTSRDQIEGVVVTFAEITSLKQAALDMQRLAAVVRDSNDAVLVADMQGRILTWNRRAEILYGYEAAQAVGLTLDALAPAELRAEQRALFERIAGGEQVGPLEVQRQRRDGRRIDVWLTTSLLRNAANDPYAVAITERDLTQSNASMRRERARQSILQSTRLISLEEMAAMLAHELNQPLSAIANFSGLANMILNSAQPDLARLREISDNLQEQALRAGALIERVRDASRNKARAHAPLDLNSIVQDAVRLSALTLGVGDGHMETALTPQPLRVMADRIEIEELLLNLIRNGVESNASEHGAGHLLVRTIRDDQEGVAQVSICDRGQGLSPEAAKQLFTPFFTTKPYGMGMGLVICRNIVERHGGRIWPEANEGGGTCFKFVLPLVKDAGDA